MLDFFIFDLLVHFKIVQTDHYMLIIFVYACLYSFGYLCTFLKLGYGRAAIALLFPVINLVIIFNFLNISNFLILPWLLLAYSVYLPFEQLIPYKTLLMSTFILLNFYISALLSYRLAQAFSRSTFFAVFLFCFGSIGYFILAFSKPVGIKQGIVGKIRPVVPGARYD